LLSAEDAQSLRVSDGQAVRLHNVHGEYRAVVCIAPVKPGNVQVHWPEGNVLLDPQRRSSESHVPDYTAMVQIEVL
jgi:anaerobic selenocysteine-containing dehydrogenase